MRLSACFLSTFVFLSGNAIAQEAPATSDVLFILDGSGSMWGRVNDVEKIVVAKDVMTGLIAGLPDDINTGLITYGHRTRGSCSDIEVVAAPGVTSRPDLLQALSGITPLGKTPIADSLLQAGELVRENENAVSVVLVSDGIESCEGDPCATAAALRAQDIDVRIHVVGFDVDAEAEEQLSCIAEAGGGEYYQAGSADALNDALSEVRTSIVEAIEEEAPEAVVTTLGPTEGNMALNDDVIGGVNVVDEETGELQVRLSGAEPKQVGAGTYILEFDHFTTPPFTVEAGEDYIVAAADYGLAVVALDGEQEGGVNLINDNTNETLLRLAETQPRQVPPGVYRLEFDNFMSPPFEVEPSGDYVFSALDFALIDVALDGTQIGGVDVIDNETGERLLRLAGTSTKQVPQVVYRFQFDNFLSRPRALWSGTSYVISPSDYDLSEVVLDGTQVGGVDVIDGNTDEKLTRLSGTTAKQIPPGTYRFAFSNFLSPLLTIAPNSTTVISPSDYGLVTVSKTRDFEGFLDLFTDGESVATMRGYDPIQVPPGEYTLVYQKNEIGEVTLQANEVRVFELE